MLFIWRHRVNVNPVRLNRIYRKEIPGSQRLSGIFLINIPDCISDNIFIFIPEYGKMNNDEKKEELDEKELPKKDIKLKEVKPSKSSDDEWESF